jgi:hypothetical protein
MLNSDLTPTTDRINLRNFSTRNIGQVVATFFGVLVVLALFKERATPQRNESKVSKKMSDADPSNIPNLSAESDSKPRQNADLITALLKENPTFDVTEDDFLERYRDSDNEVFSRAFDGLVKSRVRFSPRFLFTKDRF